MRCSLQYNKELIQRNMAKHTPKHRRINIQQRNQRRKKMRKIKAEHQQTTNKQRQAELERKLHRMSPKARLEELGTD